MRAAISSFDHAFADAPVFELTESIIEAREAARKHLASQMEMTAQAIVAVSRQFRNGAVIGDKVHIGVNARLIALSSKDRIHIAGPSAIRGTLRAEGDGSLKVGRFSYIGDNTIISARTSVSIGDATLVAHGVQIFDNNSHPTNAFQREVQFRRMLGDKSIAAELDISSAPISIGNRCWIGMNSLVLKGVEIGDDTIVAAGSVVSNSLPEGVVAAGNPAIVIRTLKDSERSAPIGK